MNKAFAGLTKDLQGRMTEWESEMQQQWLHFEKWEDKIVQMKLGTVEGHVAVAELRIRLSLQGELEKRWFDRLGREHKIMTNKYETLNSTVERLSHEITNLKERKMRSAASIVATSSGSGRSTIGHGVLGAPGGFVTPRVELKGWCVWGDIRSTDITSEEAKFPVAQIKSDYSPRAPGETGLGRNGLESGGTSTSK